ncbi:hypothetical protein ACFSM9_17125 [Microvirga arabica]|nr:hypothetical protein [Microvirga arabica]
MRQFVRISGASEAKVERWIKGDEDIPHFVTILCALLTLPNTMEMAKSVTDTMLKKDNHD